MCAENLRGRTAAGGKGRHVKFIDYYSQSTAGRSVPCYSLVFYLEVMTREVHGKDERGEYILIISQLVAWKHREVFRVRWRSRPEATAGFFKLNSSAAVKLHLSSAQ